MTRWIFLEFNNAKNGHILPIQPIKIKVIPFQEVLLLIETGKTF
jgi:hypothetical protein